jgi:diadenylate cyclase
VIIRDNRIVAAACVLTLSESSNLSRDLGTRHRAGIGVTESTDAMVIIVSEETGIISAAQGGKLTRHLDAEGLSRVLSDIYLNNNTPSLIGMWNSLKDKFMPRKARDEQ